MSKIGRKPIDISGVQVEVEGHEVRYKGSANSGVYVLPEILSARVEDNRLFISAAKNLKELKRREINRIWGLHRALLANDLQGAKVEFEKEIEIVGLGYKVILSGNKLVFSLGYSHKIDFEVPKDISFSINKSGQKLVGKSCNKELLGKICSKICDLRVPEPYKGTGVKLTSTQIIRKAIKK